MGLCYRAHYLRSCIVQIEENCKKKLYQKCSDTCARLREKVKSQEATFTKLLVGDRVLVRNMSERRGPGKLRSFWETIIYCVTKQHGDSPVYEVAPESENGRRRVLHCNMLLPCDFLPITETKLTMVDPSQPITSSKRTTQK